MAQTRYRCWIIGCNGVAQYRGICTPHKSLWSDGFMLPLKPPTRRTVANLKCIVSGCGKSVSSRNYCKSHYDSIVVRQADSNHKIRELKFRVDGDKYYWSSGYVSVYCPQHPLVNTNGYYLEHRLVMESKLGRYLLPDEHVHHINGVRNDNSVNNLELWVTSHPAGQRPQDLIRWAREILTRYGPEFIED